MTSALIWEVATTKSLNLTVIKTDTEAPNITSFIVNTNQVNLTKLESFSVKNTFDQANFYLDLEGHLEQVGVKKALEELGFHTETLDILGVYESSTFRQK